MKPPQATWFGRLWLKWQQRKCKHLGARYRHFMVRTWSGNSWVEHIPRCPHCGHRGPFFTADDMGHRGDMRALRKAKELPRGHRLEFGQ